MRFPLVSKMCKKNLLLQLILNNSLEKISLFNSVNQFEPYYLS